MTDVAQRKPPAPPLTRVVQLVGLAAVVLGTVALIDAANCEELDCLAQLLGVMAIGWGIVAVLAGLRNIFGFVCLVGSIVLALLLAFGAPWFSLPFLAVVFFLLRVSKDKLKHFYWKEREAQ